MNRNLLSQRYISCDVGETIISVVGRMANTQTYTVLVFSAKKMVGILDPHSLLRLHTSKETKIRKALEHVRKVPIEEKEEQVAMDFLDNNTHALPVVSKNKLVGIVSAIDVAEVLLDYGTAKLPIQRFATTRPFYFFEDTPIAKALPLLRNHHVDHVPIVDEHMRVSGIVSVTDILMRYVRVPAKRLGGRHMRRPASDVDSRVSAGALSIGSLASPLVVTAKPDDSVRRIIELMHENGVSSVVLTESNYLVGIITITDVLRALRSR